MRAQTKFVFQIGLPENQPQFAGGVIRAASRLCGGCTTSTKEGWWMEDGDQHKPVFEGKLEREVCFELELTCERHKAEGVYEAMRMAIADMARHWGVDTNWIHVTETQMVGRHFSIAATNREAALAAS